MAAIFGHGNPLSTAVGQLIERATDGTQPSENWGLYMEVCDKINETDEGPKDAIKAFRKRLTQNMGKNHTAVIYTLTCLETCVKNCGRRFHIHIANKDFLNDLVKVIGPKYDPPQALQEKVLSLIQTWADAFRGSPDMKEIEKVYLDLKSKGIEFPMTDLDSLAPIHTPARTQGGIDPEPVSRNRGSTTNRAEYVWVNKMPGVPRGVMWPAKIISGTADAHDVAIYVKSDNAEMTVKKANICPFDVSLKDKFQSILVGRKRNYTYNAFEADVEWVLGEMVPSEMVPSFEKLFGNVNTMTFEEFSLPLDYISEAGEVRFADQDSIKVNEECNDVGNNVMSEAGKVAISDQDSIIVNEECNNVGNNGITEAGKVAISDQDSIKVNKECNDVGNNVISETDEVEIADQDSMEINEGCNDVGNNVISEAGGVEIADKDSMQINEGCNDVGNNVISEADGVEIADKDSMQINEGCNDEISFVPSTSVRNTGQVISTAPVPVVPQVAGVPVVPTQEQLAKLQSELDVVQGNVRVMSEMLTELSPSNVDSSDLELLQELNRTNRQMQQRIVELLDGIPNEEVTNELLRVNDDLNNVFLRYERFERYRTGQTGQTQDAEPPTADSVSPPSYNDIVPPVASQTQPAPTNVGNLIDLGDETTTTTTQVADQMARMNVNGAQDDFDMFAQSRKSFDENKQNIGSSSNYVNEDQFGQGMGVGQAVNLKNQPSDEEILQLQDKETDYDEMEQWLQQHEEATGAGKPDEPISSSEFDKFLTDRASAASNLPSISAQTGAQQNRRQLQKDDDENPMFAL